MKNGHKIFFTATEEYGFLAVSISSPRFCVTGKTREDAKEKAIRALEFFHETNREVPVLSVSVRGRHFEEELVCA